MEKNNSELIYKSTFISILVKLFLFMRSWFFVFIFLIAEPLLLIGATIVLIIYFVVSRNFEYIKINDDELMYNSGIIFKKVLRVNKAKIKAVDVSKSVLGRMFNFSTINIETAVMDLNSANGTGIKMYLNDEHIKVIKEELLGNDENLECSESIENIETVEKINKNLIKDNIIYTNIPKNKDLFLCGLTSGGIFFGVFILFQGAFFAMEIGLDKILDSTMDYAINTIGGINIFTVIGLAILVFIIIMGGIGLFWILKFKNFTLSVTDKKVNIKYGFFTVKEYDFYIDDIKAVMVNSNPIRQLFSYSEIKLEVKGYRGGGIGSIMLLPFVKNSEVNNILGEFLGEFVIDGEEEKFTKGKLYFLGKPIMYNFIFSIILFMMFDSFYVFLWNLFSIVNIISRVVVIKNMALVYNDKIISGTSGGFYKQNKRFRASAIQSIQVKQTPYKNKLNIADIVIMYYSEVSAGIDLRHLSKENLQQLGRVSRGLGVDTNENKQDECYENFR